MQIYMVGGAVRDTLLGLPVQDHDWVLVGAEPQQLVAEGYLPVGKDFPVFLHPHTREEYALARTERKTAPGYRGFAVHAAPDVTLEQDLARRDLTINAMAVEARHVDRQGRFTPGPGTVTDPFGGQRDLQMRVLRHVTEAFREDPVRILRVARFAARFADFQVAPDTNRLMRDMVAHGEVAALVAERVWQELARGLMEATPSRMLEVLDDCGALAALLPELFGAAAASQAPAAGALPPLLPAAALRAVLDRAAGAAAPLPVRFACLCLAQAREDLLRTLCERLRVPTDCRDLALLAARERPRLQQADALDAAGLVALLERCDAVRKPARFGELLQVCALAHESAAAPPDAAPWPPGPRLAAAHAAVLAVRTEAIAQAAQAKGLSGPQVGQAIRDARVAAVQVALTP